MPTQRLSEPVLRKLTPGKTVWDTEVRGLGARLRVSEGGVIFLFKYRSPTERDDTGRGRQRFLTIGRWGRGDYGIDEARKAATAHRDAIRLHRDPAAERDVRKATPTVSELCDAYMQAVPTILLRRARRPKKESTLASDRGRIERHIKPLLGAKPADAVTRKDIERFMHAVARGDTAQREKLAKARALSNVRGGKGVATRTVGLLGGIFTWAVAEGIRPDNPVRGVTRFADKRRQRRLSDEEYHLLGKGLDAAALDGVNPTGIAAARLLLLTGWRMSDATNLKRSEVDTPRRLALLPETKTDESARPLARPALALIQAQPKTSNPYAFPATVDKRPLQGLPRIWGAIRSKAGLPPDVTLNVLRHSFASLGSDLGYSDAVIAALIGHKREGTTAGYIHAANVVVLKAADEIVRVTLALMAGKTRDQAVTG